MRPSPFHFYGLLRCNRLPPSLTPVATRRCYGSLESSGNFQATGKIADNGFAHEPVDKRGYLTDYWLVPWRHSFYEWCIIWKFFSQWPEAQGIGTDLDVRMEFSAIDTEGSAGRQAAHGARNHNQDRFSQLENLYSMKEALLNSRLWVLICYWTIRILLAFTVLRLIARGVINASKLTNTPFYDLMATLFGSGKIPSPGVACVDIHPAPLRIDVDSLEKQHGFPKWWMARRYDWTLIQKSEYTVGFQVHSLWCFIGLAVQFQKYKGLFGAGERHIPVASPSAK
ncbi:hypothetical protein AB1N83_004513 [Pleurotus pulmonarius]